jgi:hypothetical protein
MSDDIRKEPVRRRRAEPPMEPPDDLDVAYGDEPPFPPLVTAAGWIWIVSGILTLVLAALVAAALMIFAGGANAGGGAHLAGALWGLACFGVFGAGLLGMGVQSVRGKARDTLSNGVISIGVSLLYCGMAFVRSGGSQILHASVVHITFTLLQGLGGALLLVAGALALRGRGQYLLWRTRLEFRRGRGGRTGGAAMSEDVQKGPNPPEREASAQAHDYNQVPDIRRWQRYPRTVFAGGVLCIVWGCMIAVAFIAPWVAHHLAGDRETTAQYLIFPGLGLGGLAILAGIQHMRGVLSIKDTRNIAIGSMGGGLVALGLALSDFTPRLDTLPPGLQLAEHVLIGVIGLSAGVLFLCGRAAYKVWWIMEKARKEREGADADNPFRK